MLVLSQSHTKRLPYGFIRRKSSQQVHWHLIRVRGLQWQCWSSSQKVGGWMHTKGHSQGLSCLGSPFLSRHRNDHKTLGLGDPAGAEVGDGSVHWNSHPAVTGQRHGLDKAGHLLSTAESASSWVLLLIGCLFRSSFRQGRAAVSQSMQCTCGSCSSPQS